MTEDREGTEQREERLDGGDGSTALATARPSQAFFLRRAALAWDEVWLGEEHITAFRAHYTHLAVVSGTCRRASASLALTCPLYVRVCVCTHVAVSGLAGSHRPEGRFHTAPRGHRLPAATTPGPNCGRGHDRGPRKGIRAGCIAETAVQPVATRKGG